MAHAPVVPNTPAGSRVWRVVHFPLVLLFIAIAFSIAGSAAAGAIVSALPTRQYPLVAVGAAIIGALIFMVLYWVFARFVERRQHADELAPRGGVLELGAGTAIGLALFSTVVAIQWSAGTYRIVETHGIAAILPALGVAIASSVTEEIMLRGYFFRIVESALGSWIALLASAALFGAAHLGNPNATWFAGLAIALEAGVMLAALYMLTRRLWAAIGVHFAWNLAQGGIYGIPVSGFALPGIIKPAISGPEWLTGGQFGAEASVPALAVCTLFGIAVLVACIRRDQIVQPFWRRR